MDIMNSIENGLFLVFGALIAALASFVTTWESEKLSKKHEKEQRSFNARQTVYLKITKVLSRIIKIMKEQPKDTKMNKEVRLIYQDFLENTLDEIIIYSSKTIIDKVDKITSIFNSCSFNEFLISYNNLILQIRKELQTDH